MTEAPKSKKRELPPGWRWVELGEVSTIVSGTTPASGDSALWNGGVVWLTPTDLGKLAVPEAISSERTVSERALEVCGLTLVPPGSVVLSSRAPIGHLALARVELCTNQGCKSFVPGDALDSSYLFFALRASVAELQQIGSGATFAEVSKAQLSSFEIPLPPLPEQKRIARVLGEGLAAVEKARKAAEERLEAVNALPASFLREAFCGITPLSAEPIQRESIDGWRWVDLADLARLESGHTPSRYCPEYWGGDIRWIALPDIRELDGCIAHETSECTNSEGIENSSARLLPAGTVCLSRTASVAFVTIMGREMATSQDFVNWVCGNQLDPMFLMYLFMRSRRYIRSLASGATHQTVYMPTLKAFRVCVPAIAAQRGISESLRSELAATDAARAAAETELETINTLPAALLRQAFNGEL